MANLLIVDKIKLCLYSIPYFLVVAKPPNPDLDIIKYMLFVSVIFISADSLILFAALFGTPRRT